MKVRLALLKKEPSQPTMVEVDTPVMPRIGELIVIDRMLNYEVKRVSYYFDKQGHLDHSTVDCKKC